MIQIEKIYRKVYNAIGTGKIDVAEMSFPNLINDIIPTMTELFSSAIHDKCGNNHHIPYDILL